MMFFIQLLFLFSPISANNTGTSPANCTTVQPAYPFPDDGTSTVYASTATRTLSVTCGSCSLTSSSYPAVLGASQTSPAPTVSGSVTTSDAFACLTSTTTTSFPPFSVPSIPAPSYTTAAALPPVPNERQKLIDQLRTQILYAELIANGNPLQLCPAIDVPALDSITGINGTVSKTQVCRSADVVIYVPDLAVQVIRRNQLAVSFLERALFALQVTSGFAGIKLEPGDGENLQLLCDIVNEEVLNGISTGFNEGAGTKIKNLVCEAAQGDDGQRNKRFMPRRL